MINNINKYLRDTENERKIFLQRLTYKKSARILEELLSSELLLKMHFSDDDHPISLWKQVELKNRSV